MAKQYKCKNQIIALALKKLLKQISPTQAEIKLYKFVNLAPGDNKLRLKWSGSFGIQRLRDLAGIEAYLQLVNLKHSQITNVRDRSKNREVKQKMHR